jgi:hypothetical protein
MTVKEDGTFSCSRVFEYFAASSYPANMRFAAIFGVQSFNSQEPFDLSVVIKQNDITIGSTEFREAVIPNPYEIMNFIFDFSDDTGLDVPSEGVVEFNIYINNRLFDTQLIHAVHREG